MRRVKRFSVGTLALVVVLVGVAKFALASEYASRQVVAQIQTALGAPVRVAGVHLGYSSSSLTGVEVLENASSAPPPWSSAKAVEADLSLWQLLRSDLGGGTVVLRDAAVVLRFDRNNALLTRMPTPPPGPTTALPVVRVEGGSFTLRHEGKPDETFHNIHAELRGDGEKLSITGTIDDPDWGSWTVTGGRASAAEPVVLVLRTTKETHVTPALLRRTPFVDPTTWDAVELDGHTHCELTLRFEHDGRVRYRVDLNPHDTIVYVPAIKLRAEAAHGHVVFEDDILTLENVRGLSAGGDLKVGSVMDFRTVVSRLRFTIDAGAMNPRLLPASWAVPALDGQVTGRAELEVVLRDGRATVSGRGEGSVQVLPFIPPVYLRLETRPDGTGFRFALGRG